MVGLDFKDKGHTNHRHHESMEGTQNYPPTAMKKGASNDDSRRSSMDFENTIAVNKN